MWNIKNQGLKEIVEYVKTGECVLLLSAHPDDSAFMGGTIYRLVQEESINVVICLITPGGKGYADDPNIVKSRKAEFKAECQVYDSGRNLVETIYLPESDFFKLAPDNSERAIEMAKVADSNTKEYFPGKPFGPREAAICASMLDGEISSTNKHMREALTWLIRTRKPGAIFCPYRNDVHFDHKALTSQVIDSLWRSGRRSQTGDISKGGLGESPWHYPSQMRIYEYEVTRPIKASGLTYVDISGIPWDEKLEAFLKHPSQYGGKNRDRMYFAILDFISSMRGRELYSSQELNSWLQKWLDNSGFPDPLGKMTEDGRIESISVSKAQKIIRHINTCGPKAEAFLPVGM
jgi:LmbE family N-acetylglucosaminyl deacetylase